MKKLSLLFLLFLPLTIKAQSFFEYRNLQDSFSVSFPEHWKYYKPEHKSIKFIALRTKESENDTPRENINLNFLKEPNFNLEALYLTLKNTIGKAKKFHILEEGVITVDEKEVKWLIETHLNAVNNEKMQHYDFIYYKNEKCVILTCTALATTFEKHRGVFEEIAKSFRMF